LGHKTHPIGFRLGIIKDWQSRWFAGKQKAYRELVLEDLSIRTSIMDKYPDAGISRVEIERGSAEVIITIHTARPGIVIGRGGQRVEELRKELEGVTERKARLNVQEIRQPELDAFLVARSIADQLERRIAYRRAIRQAIGRTMQAGAKGIKVLASGRLGGAEIARKEKAMDGRIPLHTLRADIDFAIAEAATEYGRIGVKVWIYHGDKLPANRQPDFDEMTPIEVTVTAEQVTEETSVEAVAADKKATEKTPVEAAAADEKATEKTPVEAAAADEKVTEKTPVEAAAADEKATEKTKEAKQSTEVETATEENATT